MSFAPHAVERRLSGYRIRSTFPDSARAQTVLKNLLSSSMHARHDLVGVQGRSNGSGRHDGEFWESGGWFLKTRATRVFEGEVEAVRAFAKISASKFRLGNLTPEHSVVAVLEDSFGRFELWTVAPILRTIREELEQAHRLGDEVRLRRSLIGYAHCLGRALESAQQNQLSLDANPANFATQGGRPRYIDDDVAERDDAVGIEDAFLGRFVDYPDVHAHVWQDYVGRFVDEVRCCVSVDFRRRILLDSRIQAAAILKRGSAPWAERAVSALRG